MRPRYKPQRLPRSWGFQYKVIDGAVIGYWYNRYGRRMASVVYDLEGNPWSSATPPKYLIEKVEE